MVFVDGENLAIRYKNYILKNGIEIPQHVKHLENIYVWSQYANRHNHRHCTLIRSFYYTCARGDLQKIESIEDELLALGISDPRVFKKNSNNRSKRVDITLATEMLSNAYYNNYDVAILVAGDEDYVPLIQEVKRTGKQVAVWFFSSGLSKYLRKESDVFLDIEFFLCRKSDDITKYF
ncbi:NYN domain-containing protein [Aurantivibrio infirmus]